MRARGRGRGEKCNFNEKKEKRMSIAFDCYFLTLGKMSFFARKKQPYPCKLLSNVSKDAPFEIWENLWMKAASELLFFYFSWWEKFSIKERWFPQLCIRSPPFNLLTRSLCNVIVSLHSVCWVVIAVKCCHTRRLCASPFVFLLFSRVSNNNEYHLIVSIFFPVFPMILPSLVPRLVSARILCRRFVTVSQKNYCDVTWCFYRFALYVLSCLPVKRRSKTKMRGFMKVIPSPFILFYLCDRKDLCGYFYFFF